MSRLRDCTQHWLRQLDEAGVPKPLHEILMKKGYCSASMFALAFMDHEKLDEFMEDFFKESEVDQHVPNTARPLQSPLAAQIRRAWEDAWDVHRAGGDGTSSTAASCDWLDHLPPKLRPEQIQDMVEHFQRQYPGELLDDTCMPGARLLSTVCQMLRPGGEPRWLPWKHLISKKQESDLHEARALKTPRADMLHVLQAVWDEPPVWHENDTQGAPYKIQLMQTVRRNAFVLCDAAHLQVFRAFDSKVLSMYTNIPPSDSGLRPPNLQELIAADRHLWGEIFRIMHSLKWNMDKALHEITFLRVDISTWLQPKPKPAKAAPAPPAPPAKRQWEQGAQGRPNKKGKGGKGKEGGKGWEKGHAKNGGGKGKSKQGKGRFNPAYATELWENGKRLAICMRWQDNNCTSTHCKFVHRCAVKDSNGVACGKNHRASEHDAASAPRT